MLTSYGVAYRYLLQEIRLFNLLYEVIKIKAVKRVYAG